MATFYSSQVAYIPPLGPIWLSYLSSCSCCNRPMDQRIPFDIYWYSEKEREREREREKKRWQRMCTETMILQVKTCLSLLAGSWTAGGYLQTHTTTTTRQTHEKNKYFILPQLWSAVYSEKEDGESWRRRKDFVFGGSGGICNSHHLLHFIASSFHASPAKKLWG